MAEIQKSFTAGVMDMGTDARLVQDGLMRYAVNVDVAGSESSDQGVVQNIRGNVTRNLDIPVFDETTTVIGAAVSNVEEKVYYFWVSQSAEGIYEYDASYINPATGSGRLNRILEFTKSTSEGTTELNFSLNHLITGAVVIDNLLIWTDGLNPIRKVNIDRFRGSGDWVDCDGAYGQQSCPGQDNVFVEEGGEIKIQYYNSLSGSFEDCPGEEGAQLCTASEHDVVNSIRTIKRKDQVVAQYVKSTPDPMYDADGEALVDFTSGNAKIDAILSTNPYIGDFINLAKRPPLFPPNITSLVDGITDDDYEINKAGAEDKLFDTFARFAIRYKYRDGETSSLSPFSEPAFIPDKYRTDTETGIMESMVNIMKAVDISFDVGDHEVKEIDIVYKESDSGTIYLVETIKKDNTYIDQDTKKIVGFDDPNGEKLKSSTAYIRSKLVYNYDGSKIYRALPSSELARIYDNVPIRAKALELAGNRLVLGNFTENYSFKRRNENGEEIIPRFNLTTSKIDRSANPNDPFKTIKTGRDYQVGVVYLDQEGRQSPVRISENNSINVPYSDSQNRIKLELEIHHEAPYWATHYRPFIKQNKGVFYNIIPTTSHYVKTGDLETDGKMYLRINDADLNKADVGDVLVRKISQGDVLTNVEYWRIVEAKRLLDVEGSNFEDNKLPASLTTAENWDGTGEKIAEEGYYLVLAPTVANYTIVEDNLYVFDADSVWETIPADNLADIYYEGHETFRIINGRHTDLNAEIETGQPDVQLLDDDGKATSSIKVSLNWHNCYGYGNGVESMVIEDKFNSVAVDQGARASTTQDELEQYDKESWLIHSGVYVDATNLNRLNEFNVSLPLQKDLDINDGSIQKLHFRDTNLVVFQERKVKNVPINKNVIVTADGNGLATGGSQFYGVEGAYAGEYGIAKNPESFATYGNRIYFADKNRGAILRLGGDGITEISKNGVEAYIRRYIADAHYIKLFYNDYADEVDVSLQNLNRFVEINTNKAERRIAAIGALDPHQSCNSNLDGLDFEKVYTVMRLGTSNTAQFLRGDRVYVDDQRHTPFNGGYDWYLVEKGGGAGATYNETIQISPNGVVTRVIDSCSEAFPRELEWRRFSTSREAFQSEVDACANGLLNDIAFFGPGRNQTNVGREPVKGNFIYDASDTFILSSRSGWFKISIDSEEDEDGDGFDDYKYWVIKIQDGVVIDIFECDQIDKGRTAFYGSNVITDLSGATEFQKKYSICFEEREEKWWIDANRQTPLIGDTIYHDNFQEETAGAGYISLDSNNYVKINSSGVVTEINQCGGRECTTTPEEYVIRNPEVPVKGPETITLSSWDNSSYSYDLTLDSSFNPKLNDYYETSAGAYVYRTDNDANTVCVPGAANCVRSVKNDLTNDSSVFDNNDPVTFDLIRYDSNSNPIQKTEGIRGRVIKDSSSTKISISAKTDYIQNLTGDTFAIDNIQNHYKVRFLGVDVTSEINGTERTDRVGLPKIEINFFEKGQKRYPVDGHYTTTIERSGTEVSVEEDRNYKISKGEIEVDEREVEVGLIELCYDLLSGSTAERLLIKTTGYSLTQAPITGNACDSSTTDSIYYNPKLPIPVYYTSPTLDEGFIFDSSVQLGSGNYFGISNDNGDDDNDVATTEWVQFIDDNGKAGGRLAVNCDYGNTISLAYAQVQDFKFSEQVACENYEDSDNRTSYWTDNSTFSSATKIFHQNNALSVPADGYYTNGTIVRELRNGTFRAGIVEQCFDTFDTLSLSYNASSLWNACDEPLDTPVHVASKGLSKASYLYGNEYGTSAAQSGYYTNGIAGGYWDQRLEEFTTWHSCGNCVVNPYLSCPCTEGCGDPRPECHSDCNHLVQFTFEVASTAVLSAADNTFNIFEGDDYARTKVYSSTTAGTGRQVIVRVDGEKREEAANILLTGNQEITANGGWGKVKVELEGDGTTVEGFVTLEDITADVKVEFYEPNACPCDTDGCDPCPIKYVVKVDVDGDNAFGGTNDYYNDSVDPDTDITTIASATCTGEGTFSASYHFSGETDDGTIVENTGFAEWKTNDLTTHATTTITGCDTTITWNPQYDSASDTFTVTPDITNLDSNMTIIFSKDCAYQCSDPDCCSDADIAVYGDEGCYCDCEADPTSAKCVELHGADGCCTNCGCQPGGCPCTVDDPSTWKLAPPTVSYRYAETIQDACFDVDIDPIYHWSENSDEFSGGNFTGPCAGGVRPSGYYALTGADGLGTIYSQWNSSTKTWGAETACPKKREKLSGVIQGEERTDVCCDYGNPSAANGLYSSEGDLHSSTFLYSVEFGDTPWLVPEGITHLAQIREDNGELWYREVISDDDGLFISLGDSQKCLNKDCIKNHNTWRCSTYDEYHGTEDTPGTQDACKEVGVDNAGTFKDEDECREKANSDEGCNVYVAWSCQNNTCVEVPANDGEYSSDTECLAARCQGCSDEERYGAINLGYSSFDRKSACNAERSQRYTSNGSLTTSTTDIFKSPYDNDGKCEEDYETDATGWYSNGVNFARYKSPGIDVFGECFNIDGSMTRAQVYGYVGLQDGKLQNLAGVPYNTGQISEQGTSWSGTINVNGGCSDTKYKVTLYASIISNPQNKTGTITVDAAVGNNSADGDLSDSPSGNRFSETFEVTGDSSTSVSLSWDCHEDTVYNGLCKNVTGDIYIEVINQGSCDTGSLSLLI